MTNTVITLIFYTLIGICRCRHTFVINSELNDSEDELVSVVVLYRHGDRSPFVSFPKDPYIDSSYWPEGYGKLLAKGVRRQYTLGQWLRQRYDGFLPSEYSSNDVIVYSTDVDRTLMSAQANLAGLYPPVESQVWEENFLWQPIPIHLLHTDDPVLAMDSACPKFNDLMEEVEIEMFQNVTIEYSELLSNLSNHIEMNITSTDIVNMIYDVYYVYLNHNESYLPSWIDEVDIDEIRYIAGLNFGKHVFTETLRRLKTGPFFDYLINNFKEVIANNNNKLLMLSAHDITISSLLGGMGAYDNHPPEFASALIWELRKNSKEQHYVNVMYKRNSSDTFEQIFVNGCNFDCILTDFEDNLSAVTVEVETWQEECKGNNSVTNLFSWSLLLVTVAVQYLSRNVI